MARTKNTMNLFEVMDAVDIIDWRLKEVEKFAHEPQNYKNKCDEMQRKINRLEQKLKVLIRYKK